ncbi:enoyl-CoA hydratase/isomerase family protein [Saccharopolyspora sp. WRP15-2]|uniref:Enoyl-CoA hydratase/isomerase family protein n=1 Tax=Saccharopolyspora oryzae TaxID=2997343 RepID=A0ABT4VBS0_9PSEU|nr:enoyl-CoA hydratase/isomerase family protein [Saccharopolyspora oryzae]MDA3630737.1 enoyl-CoA hydratase/isomerase family protein [Saccharopolyspora oryzae]
MTEILRVDRPERGVVMLTLNRPRQLNALNGALVDELLAALESVDGEWPDTGVIVLNGAGRAFCAGVDLKWVNSGVLQDPAAHNAFHDKLNELCHRLESARQVVVAAVHGYAVAGGFELLLACDLVIAAKNACMGDNHIRHNFLPAAGGSQRLPRKIGVPRSLYLLLTGHRMDGDEALRCGLACESVEESELIGTAMKLARGIAGSDARALSSMKSLVRRGMELPLAEALWIELHEQHRYRSASAALEQGVADFANRDTGISAQPPT